MAVDSELVPVESPEAAPLLDASGELTSLGLRVIENLQSWYAADGNDPETALAFAWEDVETNAPIVEQTVLAVTGREVSPPFPDLEFDFEPPQPNMQAYRRRLPVGRITSRSLRMRAPRRRSVRAIARRARSPGRPSDDDPALLARRRRARHPGGAR
jgi:hypothetical protein